jgi:hypothetical protein
VLPHVRKDQEARKEKVIQQLERAMKLLLPGKPDDIHSIVTQIVDKAVTLANDMTEEQILFRCYMIHAGQQPTEAIVHVADSEQTGRVILCTFPGFGRKVWEDGKVQLIPVVKASVELESAFV